MFPGIAILLGGHAPELMYVWLACGAGLIAYLWHGLNRRVR